jgi:hypothetical protein
MSAERPPSAGDVTNEASNDAATDVMSVVMPGGMTDDELAELAMAADPDAPLDPDAIPLRLGDPGAALLPEWYMPSTLRADAFGRTRRGRSLVVGGIVAALLLVNGVGLCVTYGFPEIAW